MTGILGVRKFVSNENVPLLGYLPDAAPGKWDGA